MENIVKKLKEEVKKKEELAGISDKVLEETITNYIDKNRIELSNATKDKDLKIIIKEVRDSLRLMHGRFQVSLKKRKKALRLGNYEDILKSHRSTLERIEIYPKVKELINKIDPSSILDVACGLNPLALSRPGCEYIAIDINEEETKVISNFFKEKGLVGKVICSDVRKIDFSSIDKVDLCLIFKFLDFIEDSHKNAEFLLKNIKCNYFLISFATKSISGKSKRQTRRIWFERIIKKLNYEFESFEFNNEIFYQVRKQ